MRPFPVGQRLILALIFSLGCGRKGDPVPIHRIAPRAPLVSWTSLRVLRVRLPEKDIQGNKLVGVDKVRVYYVPLALERPAPEEVLSRGEIVAERRRPDLPSPGKDLTMDLGKMKRPPGWVSVVVIRLGEALGQPSDPLAWLNPEF